MKEQSYIENGTLPIEVNFLALKERGLAYIQENNEGTWTNLNDSDPGVTILDQVCFALTELGYCNDFPIKDILTNKNGKLAVKNQFYLPEDILTTSPVTIEDFRKYVVDKIKEVINLQITPVTDSLHTNGIYKVAVLIDAKVDKEKQVALSIRKDGKEEIIFKSQEAIILENTFFVLNTCRNLGELFLYPESLKSKEHTVYGNLEIENGYDINSILINIEYAINNYVFPKLIQKGYDELRKQGESVNTIFNGPKLKNGWISEKNMQPKRNRIQAYELTEVIQSVKGVLSISDVTFSGKDSYEVFSLADEILTFNFIESSNLQSLSNTSNSLYVYSKGRILNEGINTSVIKELSNLDQPISQISKVSAVKMAPEVPEGTYRDISSYFSIQNTFPDVYAVGSEGVSANATAFQIAQSRQLKGYLTLFDQVLTNQFMQLANLERLFSFENSVTGDPTDTEHFYSVQTAYEKLHPKYPSPYICFSPTYYYQSLYKEVPHIRPLLRNFKKHQFSYEMQTPEQEIMQGWTQYQNDPYNSYMWGLMSFMENEEVNLDRRNTMLDHLLARHGESPMIIDTIVEGTVYSGNSQKDRVIIKSLYLQNLGMLSYYRTKAYNFIGANRLRVKHIITSAELPEKFYQKLREKLVQGNQKNFIFDTLKVNKEQQIENIDFTNYSAVELKLNLLFALNVYYQDYLIQYNNSYAYWLITQRKGFLCIETNLLKESADYEIVITEGESYWKIDKKVSYNEVVQIENLLKNQTTLHLLQTYYSITKVAQEKENNDCFKTLENSSYAWCVNVSETKINHANSLFVNNTLIFIFPDFFQNSNEFKIINFKNRLHYFLENELPVQVASKSFFVVEEVLKELIIAYSKWYNNLRFHQKNGTLHGPELASSARHLIALLVQLNQLQK